jgi:tRNA A37 threonylcarbamoyladenosine dehydratase
MKDTAARRLRRVTSHMAQAEAASADAPVASSVAASGDSASRKAESSGSGIGSLLAAFGAGCAVALGAQAALGGSNAGRAVRRPSAPQASGGSDSAPSATSAAALPALGSDAWARIVDEQYSRNRFYFGEQGQAAIENAFVVVVGLGGVGSHAAHMLLRSGVSRVRLIDFDNVTVSSLNRHVSATHEDVGIPKVKALAQFCRKFNPRAEIDARVAMFNAEAAGELLDGAPDYVLDCIDDVATKAALLVHCQKRGLNVIASMGAGARVDPSRLHLGVLADVHADRLAVAVRKELRRAGVSLEVPVVYSSEQPAVGLRPLSDEQRAAPQEFGTVPGMRLSILPVVGTMPAMFGMAMASKVLTELAAKPIADPEVMPVITAKLAHKLFQRFQRREESAFGTERSALLLDALDVAYVVSNLWRRRDTVTEQVMGKGQQPTLSRWDATKVSCILCTVTLYANLAHSLTRSPKHI